MQLNSCLASATSKKCLRGLWFTHWRKLVFTYRLVLLTFAELGLKGLNLTGSHWFICQWSPPPSPFLLLPSIWGLGQTLIYSIDFLEVALANHKKNISPLPLNRPNGFPLEQGDLGVTVKITFTSTAVCRLKSFIKFMLINYTWCICQYIPDL